MGLVQSPETERGKKLGGNNMNWANRMHAMAKAHSRPPSKLPSRRSTTDPGRTLPLGATSSLMSAPLVDGAARWRPGRGSESGITLAARAIRRVRAQILHRMRSLYHARKPS
jgi:hypothetical protein